jgi:hypothetical protein
VLTQNVFEARTEDLFWETKRSNTAYLLANRDRVAVRRGDYKYVSTGHSSFLYNLATDPGEQTNISSQQPQLKASLQSAHQAWRKTESKIDAVVAITSGDVEELGGDDYDFNGGFLSFATSTIYNTADRDFSIQFRITPYQSGTQQLIAKKAGSWKLRFMPQRTIRFEAWDDAGTTTVLLSNALPLNQPTDVLITGFGYNAVPQTIRLYINGSLVKETNDIANMAFVDSPVEMSSTVNPLYALIEDLGFYLVALDN